MKLQTHMLYILLLSVFALSNKIVFAQNYQGDVDFAIENEFGDTVYYYYQGEIGSANVLVGEMKNTSTPFKTDSLVIPSNVSYEGNTHVVTGMVAAAFHYIPKHVNSITLPATFDTIEGVTTTGFAHSSFVNIYVEESNPKYSSVQGILFDKDEKVLVAYPPMREDSVFVLKEGVAQLGKNAFCCTHIIKTLILPNSLKTIGDRAFFEMSSLEELTLQDSVHILGRAAFSRTPIRKLIVGSQMQEVNYSIFNGGSMSRENDSITFICHTLVPPVVNCNQTTHTTFSDNSSIYLYVPRQSLHLYQQAPGWKDCARILPIEPPTVVGLNTAEISWVQNFSATGYVWILYTDEAKTQRFMTLTFDAGGRLVNIDINSGRLPERMPALYGADGGEDEGGETRFAEYYSFTISGLSSGTMYYYTRQSLSGTEVIDEETGSFVTLGDDKENIGNVQRDDVRCTKELRDGKLYIRRSDGTVFDALGQTLQEY